MPYTVIFFASSELALPLLKALGSDTRFKIVALVTQPDKLAGREGLLKKTDTALEANTLGLRVLKPEKLVQGDSIFNEILKNPPDFFLSFAYGQWIPEAWLEIPKIAALNVHPSLLPKYRGPSPIQSALLNGDLETGITLMKMEKEMDTGPIAAHSSFKIDTHSTFRTLFFDLGNLAAQLIPNWMSELTQKNPDQRFKVQDHEKATYTKKIKKENGRVDFKKSAREIFNQFRAYIAWPGIFTTYEGKRLKLLELEVGTDVLEPGTVHCEKHYICIGTSDGSLRVKRLQLEGKNPLYSESFILGQTRFCSTELNSEASEKKSITRSLPCSRERR